MSRMIKVPSWIEEVQTNLTRLKPLHRQYEACIMKSSMKAALHEKYDKLIRDAQKEGWLPDSARQITGQEDPNTPAADNNTSTDPAQSKPADQDTSYQAQLEKKRQEARAQQQQAEERQKEIAAKAKEAKRQVKLAKRRQQQAQEQQQAQQAYEKQKTAWQSTLEKIQKSIDTAQRDKEASARQLDELSERKDTLVNQLLLKTEKNACQGEVDDAKGGAVEGNITTPVHHNTIDDVLNGGGYSWQIKR